jgi:predicted amidophosphoribosyltransferase
LYLAKLVDQGKISKQGLGAHVTYHIVDNSHIPTNTVAPVTIDHTFSYAQSRLLDDHFLKYDADGTILQGVEGFLIWCQQRNNDPYEAYDRYAAIYTTLNKLYNECGLLDATQEFAKHVETKYLDTIYYGDQYRLNEFGRSKIAEMGFYGKALQNKELLDKVIGMIIRKIECLIKSKNIDAIALTPPSINDRKYQILDILNTKLSHINLPRINLVKDYPTNIRTPQKTLKKREDRIRNAKNSIYVYDDNAKNYHKVLLIDDFVGSGSTLNETAAKLKAEGVSEVIGLAIVGNMDLSYEVINEI